MFWLALASTQWSLGRLQENVKQEALEIIENGSDLLRWETDKALLKKRKVVLDRIKGKLNRPQPQKKKVKKRYVFSSTWKKGEVYSYKLKSGNHVLFHVIGFHKDKGGRFPVCEILDIDGQKIPPPWALLFTGYKQANPPSYKTTQFIVGSLKPYKIIDEKFKLVARHIWKKQKVGGYSIIILHTIDQRLYTLFGLE